LSAEDQLAVSKLAAILRLADALDRSHRQKYTDVTMRLETGRLVIVGRALSDTLLEEWTFAGKSEFFGEVFGLQCELKTKGLI
jgi:exopolyphosphatase/guanosine-5'-triphosphate,3'-diphosphate pyrophosphatase